jgi:hypothetical protein
MYINSLALPVLVNIYQYPIRQKLQIHKNITFPDFLMAINDYMIHVFYLEGKMYRCSKLVTLEIY